jgi:hypothetical protein
MGKLQGESQQYKGQRTEWSARWDLVVQETKKKWKARLAVQETDGGGRGVLGGAEIESPLAIRTFSAVQIHRPRSIDWLISNGSAQQ